MDIDLNIDNYDLNDILKLFKIPFNYTQEDLKNCKKVVLKTHPDKSQLDKKYFLFFTKAYKLLFQIYTFRHKINIKQEDFEKDYDPEYDIEKENDEIINKIKSSKNFNKLFNEIFENMSINNNKNGYGDWIKNETSNLANLNCKNIREMRNVINKKKSTMDTVLSKYDFNEMHSSYGLSNLEDSCDNYSSDIFSKLRYDDLKDAHENTLIPVIDTNVKQKYNTVEDIKRERNNIIQPHNEIESNNILNRQKISEEEAASIRAFTLAKQAEESQLKTETILSKFKQIMN